MNDNQKQRIEPRNISMYPDDWQTVAKVADLTGVRSLSAALRIIIREFALMDEIQNVLLDRESAALRIISRVCAEKKSGGGNEPIVN